MRLLPVVRGENSCRLSTIKMREHWRIFCMVRKSVDYPEEQMTE